MFAGGAGTARAHKVSAVSVVSEIDTASQTFKVELAMDVDPTGDPTIDDQIPPEKAATTFATESLTLYFDDQEVSVEPEIKIITESDEATPNELKRKKAIGTLRGSIPKDSENFLLYVNESTEAAVVMVVIKDGKPARRLQVLYPGEFSNPVSVLPVIEGDPFEGKDGEKKQATAAQPETKETPDAPTESLAADRTKGEEPAEEEKTAVGPGNAGGTVPPAGHFKSGFQAMLTKGLDLWLAVLALALLAVKPGPVVRQLAVVLVAHVVGFFLAKTGTVDGSMAAAGPVAALGAAILAIDNLFSERLRAHRAIAIVAIGFFQGLVLARFCSLDSGSASALAGWLGGAAGATIGLGLLALLILGPLANKAWFRYWVRTPACVLIAGVSIFRGLEYLI